MIDARQLDKRLLIETGFIQATDRLVYFCTSKRAAVFSV